MTKEPRKKDEERSKIFPGKGDQKPVVEKDTETSTKPVTDSRGNVYTSDGKGYKGKHKR